MCILLVRLASHNTLLSFPAAPKQTPNLEKVVSGNIYAAWLHLADHNLAAAGKRCYTMSSS